MAHSIPDSFARRAHLRARHDAHHRRLQVRPDPGGRRARRRRPARRAGPRGRAAAVRRLHQRRPARDRRRRRPSVGPALEEVFARCEGRIVVTSFASNIHRVQQVVDAAAALGRKVVAGRPLDAQEREHRAHARATSTCPRACSSAPRRSRTSPTSKLVVLSTGSQGEPLSALRRMAHGDHPQVELHAGDTVIFSATPIPGNERAVNETIDRIYRLGATVITTADVPVHASGHGYAEELKLMLNLTKPRYVMPVHGDHKRLHLHGRAGRGGGHRRRSRSSSGENGLPLEIDGAGARFGERGAGGHDLRRRRRGGGHRGRGPARPPHALRRRHLHRGRDRSPEQDGRSVAPPEIIFRGVPFIDETDGFVDELRDAVDASLARSAKERDPRDRPAPGPPARRRGGVRLRALRRRPMILPVVVEV